MKGDALDHRVFISYATEDADKARVLCRILEAEEGIRCWMAPRDVEAGTDYAAAILDAIKGAEMVVLLFSSFANTSPYILREIERAIAYERPVVSVRLDDTTPSASLEYYLNTLQWLDVPRGIESKRREIVGAVRRQLEGTGTPAGVEVAATAPRDAPKTQSQTAAASLEGERRLVTVLSAAVSGCAAYGRELDPEVLHELVANCLERLLPAIERHGGVVDSSAGKEVVAVFGAPRAHENDPERALRAALEMREALASFNKGRPDPVTAQLGVNTGLVLIEGPRDGVPQGSSVIGEVVGVAASLRNLAKPGEILVGPDAYRQTEHLFSWQAEGQVQAKGKSRRMSAYRLLEARSGGPGGSGRQTRGLVAPLVGRERELRSLTGCLARLREGKGGIVLLTGEAGLGKSRLVAETRARAEREGISWLEGHSLSFGRTISYWPLLEIIQQDTGIESDDPESERWAKLAARVGSLFGEERNEILPYLGTLLSISLPESLAQRVRYLDGEAMGRQVYRATRLYFARMASRRPTVVVFEDVHWLDGSTASLLEHLLPLTIDAPILYCLVARPETETALAGLRELSHSEHAERLTEIALAPLSAEESAVLICSLVHLEELPPRLRDNITDKAEGNPFYVEEVVRSLIDLGGLVRDEATGRCQVTDKAAHIPIPDTLQGVIVARIDRLDEDLKHVLRLASVVGRTFFYRVLAAIGEAERELDQCLATLEARELIQEKAREPELEYLFKHALVQEATYQSILLARRKELHRQVALAIETLFPARLEEFYPLLAYHYSEAQNWEKAQDYLFKAGDQAGKIAADAEALAHYEEAVDAYSRAFGDKWDPLDRSALERKMGDALYRRGEHGRALEYLYRALKTLERPMPESPGAVRRRIGSEICVQAWHRLWPWFKPSPLPPVLQRRVEECLRVYQSLGWVENFADQERGMLICLTALNTAEKHGCGQEASSGYAYMGMMLTIVPIRRLARWYLARARASAEREGWPANVAFADLVCCMYELWLVGDLATAWDYAQRSWGRSRELGDIRTSAGIAMGVGVHIPAERGEFDRALAMAREIAQIGRDAGDHLTEIYGQAWEAELVYMTGELTTGESGMRQAIDGMLAAPDYRIASKVAGRLTSCLLDEGKLGEARALVTLHREYVRRHALRGFNVSMVVTGAAAVALATVEHPDGSRRSAALREAKRACSMALKQGKFDTMAFVPAYRLQGSYQWLLGHPDQAEKWWRKSLDHAQELGCRYEGALTMLEWGRRTGDRAQLEHAESEFEAMGCEFFLSQARQRIDAGAQGYVGSGGASVDHYSD
jgi:class 3 adenylate cyclase/tetratricopeptide (TPR) repeat protein